MHRAIELYVAAEAEIEDDFGCFNWLLAFRNRRAAALYTVKRWNESLAVLDGLISDMRKLEAAGLGHVFQSEDRPDEIPTIYWTRAVCLDELGRRTEARDAIGDLIEQIGSGATPTQRAYLGDAYVLQARIAESQGQHAQASAAVDAALRHSERYDEPWSDACDMTPSGFRQACRRRQRRGTARSQDTRRYACGLPVDVNRRHAHRRQTEALR